MTQGVVRRRPIVLVVEDDVVAARLLALMLRQDGFDVDLAFDGATAIARLGREPTPDVLVTDYYLPHLDGVAVARYARTRRVEMPIVMMTGYPGAFDGDPNAFGASLVVLTKPLEYEPLARILGELTSLDASHS